MRFLAIFALMIAGLIVIAAEPSSGLTSQQEEDAGMLESNKRKFESAVMVYRKPCGEIIHIRYDRTSKPGDAWVSTCSNGAKYLMWQTECSGSTNCVWHFDKQ
jgi:hypothetical protein